MSYHLKCTKVLQSENPKFSDFFLLNLLPFKNILIYYMPLDHHKFFFKQAMTIEQIIKIALQTKESAVAPFSKFKVGAVLVTKDDRLYHGCNIETSSFGLTICAERVAIFKAVSEGEREFKSIFIA